VDTHLNIHAVVVVADVNPGGIASCEASKTSIRPLHWCSICDETEIVHDTLQSSQQTIYHIIPSECYLLNLPIHTANSTNLVQLTFTISEHKQILLGHHNAVLISFENS